MPSISTISTGVNAAARNQRRLFQNQVRPASETSPAAAAGVTAASTISAALRVIMTSRCPIAASHNNNPISPSTVATVPSVMSSTLNGAHGCQVDQLVTFSSDLISARVRPPHAYTTATPNPTQPPHTTRNWPSPRSTTARLFRCAGSPPTRAGSST